MNPLNRRGAALTLSGALLTAVGACSTDNDPGAAPDTPAPTATTSAGSDCPPITGNHIDLDPGCWALESPGIPTARLTLPAGLVGQPGAVWLPTDELGDPAWGHLGTTTTGDVFPDPCTRTTAPPPNSETIRGFADALAAQKISTTTAPVPVSLGGYDGLQVTLSVPADFDTSRCNTEELGAWQVGEAGIANIDVGTVQRLWVVDVEGEPLILVLTTNAGGAKHTIDRLTDVVESATFVPG